MDRYGLGTSAGLLALLAVAACLFTAFLEAGWIWAYQDYEPSEILSIYFTLALGIPPMWKILGLGLLIALGPPADKLLRESKSLEGQHISPEQRQTSLRSGGLNVD
jgi:hypothetical protein